MKRNTLKRIMSLLLCLCMVLGYVPAQVFAAEVQVASVTVNGTKTFYSTFKAAMDAANAAGEKATITFLKNIDNNAYAGKFALDGTTNWETAKVTGDVTINFNSCNLYRDMFIILVEDGASLTLDGTGRYYGSGGPGEGYRYLVENHGTLSVGSNVEIDNTSVNNSIENLGTATIYGTVDNVWNKEGATANIYGTVLYSASNRGGTANIYDGSQLGTKSPSAPVSNTHKGEVRIFGGTISGSATGSGIHSESGTVYISGGTIQTKLDASLDNTNYSPAAYGEFVVTGGSFPNGLTVTSNSSRVPAATVADVVADGFRVVKDNATVADLNVASISGVVTVVGECSECVMDSTTGYCTNGCGSFVAKVAVWDQMIDDKLYYYEGIDSANQFEPSASSTLCMKLLEDVTAQGTSGIFHFAGKSIQLDLNGHTLTAPALQYSDNAVVKVIDTSEGGEGKISTTSHFIKSGAKLTLESGTLDHAVIVQGTLLVSGGTVANTVTMQGEGSLTVNNGVISSAGYGIVAETDTVSITVTGGTISGGKDANALYNRGNSGKIALSGGVFMGGIWACDNTLADTDEPEYLLSDLLADGYGYAVYDTTSGVGDSFAGTDFRSTDNLTVVCVHKNIGYAGDGDLATAYCRNNNCHLPANTALGTLQVVAEDAVYDGEPHGASVKATGILENIATRLVYQDVSSGEILNGPPSKVGTYSVTCYSDIYASPSAEYKITEATPVYTWNTPVQTKTYTGETVEITAPVPTHLEGSDAFGGTFTYAYTGTTAGGKNVSGQGLPTDAGEYTISASVAAWGSYKEAAVSNTLALTIKKAPLTVTAENKDNVIYGGAAPEYTANYSGFVGGQDETVLEGALTFSSDYDTTKAEKRNVGEYDIVPGGVTSANYEIEFKKGTLTVKPLEVTVSIDNQSVEYGEAGILPHQYTFTLQQTLPYGETLEDVKAVISVTSDYTQGMAANQERELKQNGFRDESGNYELTEVLPGVLTITQRKIWAVMTGSATKVYDGTTTVPQNSGLKIDLTGTIATDVVSAEAALAYGQKNVGIGITVIAENIKLTGADAENYQLMNTSLSGAVGEIKKAPLTVKAASEDVFYGGAEPKHSVTYTGFVAGEDKSVLKGKLTLSCDYDTAKAAKRNAGVYAILPGGLTSDNYEIAFVPGALEVKPLPVTLRINHKTLAYGEPSPRQYSFTLQQTLPYGETLESVKASVSVDSAYTQGASAGSVFELRANVFSDGSGNYQLTQVLPGKLTVTTRKVDVKLTGSVTKAYDGTTSVPGTNDLKLTLTNILEDDVVSATGSFHYGQKTVGEKIAISAESIKLTGAHAGNYTLTSTTASAKVGKITKATPVLGKVTAKELVDTTDLSKVILTASNTSIPGTFTVDPGQTLEEGENTVSYTFTPKDAVNYQKVTGTVTVTVTKTVYDGGEDCPLQQFTDVTSKHWAHHGMDFAVNNGLMKGTGSGKTFEPDTNMSRAMLVTVLWRYSGEPDAPDCNFTDVEADDWFYEAVAWAASEGVVKGMGDGSWFDPNGDVTREMLATILCRYAEMIGVDTSARASLAGFPDEEKVAGWSYNYMKWAVAEGIITGAARDGKTYLDPQVSANRAVVATIMMRFIQSFEK